MNVAKCLLFAVLALPFLELAAFIAVAAGRSALLWALALIGAGSFAGAMVLRHAGGNHIARVRVAMGDGGFTALQADGAGTAALSPGFCCDSGVYHRRPGSFAAHCRRCGGCSPRSSAATPHDRATTAWSISTPEQWHQVPDPALPRRRRDDEH